MNASDEQRARLRRGKGPPQKGCAHLRKEGADHQEGGRLRRRDHVRADGAGITATRTLIGSPVGFGLNDLGQGHVSRVVSWDRLLTMVVKGVVVFADVPCAYSALWDVSL